MTPSTGEQAARALTEAIRLAEAGYHLTPVTISRRPDGKKVAKFHRPSWRNEGDVSNDPQIIRAWWVDHPDTSFALVCGPSGVEGVDLDVKPTEDIDAVSWWAEQSHPLGSLVVETQSGGLHLIWRRRAAGPTLPNRAGQLTRGVDTRSEGGVFFAAGGYVLGEPGHYTVLGDLPRVDELAETPTQVLGLFPQGKKADRAADGQITTHTPEWVTEKCREQLDLLRRHPRNTGGYRHKLMGAAMVLGRAVEAGISDREHAVRRLREACAVVWGSPDGEDEQWIQDGLRDGPARERWRLRLFEGVPLKPAAEPTDGATVDDPEPPGPEPADEPAGPLSAYLLPRDVWDRSPVLAHIHRAAMALITCPDAVLHAVLTIVASVLHPESRVDTGKRPSVLSSYLALIAPSGGGKSESQACARLLLQKWVDDRAERIRGGYVDSPLGSGEGLVEAFIGIVKTPILDRRGNPVTDPKTGVVKTENTRRQVRGNALFAADEGRQVLAIAARQGATILGILCELWSGAVAGQSNASKDRTRRLASGSYVLGLIAGWQLDTVDDLFADAAGGTPQRFAFAPAVYPQHAVDLDADEAPWPGDLVPDIPEEAVTVYLSPDQRREVVHHVRLRAAGLAEDGPLDGHRMLLRCRLAALLALLHGECHVPEWVWHLAGQMVARSCALRDHLAGQRERREQAKAEARRRTTVATQTEVARVAAKDELIGRAARSIVRAVEKAGGQEVRGRAMNAIRSDLRHVRDEALALAIADGRLVEVDGGPLLKLAADSE